MRKWGLGVLVLLGIGILGCMSSREAEWKQTPEATRPYKEIWDIVVEAVLTNGFNIKQIDGTSGYLESDWKEYSGGFFGNDYRLRVVCKAEMRDPCRVRVKVERWVNEQSCIDFQWYWVCKGNDAYVEDKIYQEIVNRSR